MSISDVKYFNLLVHYGLGSQNNFIQLLDEALLDVFADESKNTFEGIHTLKIYDTRYFVLQNQFYITGLLYKEGNLKWESVPNEIGEPILEPGRQAVMPYARYIISVSDHRLFWITKRGLTKSPSAYDFCYFIKKKTLEILRAKYTLEAEAEWLGNEEEIKELGFKNKRHYVGTYLKENKLNSKLFEIRAVPEVSSEAVNNIIDDQKYIIKGASFFPHMNNVTDDDCEELFTTADKVASEAESEATITLKPKSSEEGIKKETVKQILDINQKHNLLKFSLSLKNVHDKRERPLVVSNVSDADTKIAKTGAVEGEPLNSDILESVKQKFPDIVGDNPVDDDIKNKIENSGIGRIDVD